MNSEAAAYARAAAVLLALVLVIVVVALLSGGFGAEKRPGQTNTRAPAAAGSGRAAGVGTGSPSPSASRTGTPGSGSAQDGAVLVPATPAELLAVEPGLPGGILLFSTDLLAALEPGFPAGLQLIDGPTPAEAAQAPPGGPPAPPPPPGFNTPGGPSAAGAFPGVLQPTPSTGPSVPPPPASFPSGPVPGPGPVTVPPPSSFPSAPVTVPSATGPVSNVPGASVSQTASGPAEPGSAISSGAAGAIPIQASAVSARGGSITGPRVQAFAGGTLCADETARQTSDPSVSITLPGMCAALPAGTVLSFRIAGFDAVAGPIASPVPACSVSGDGATYRPVAVQPDAGTASVTLRTGSPALPGCPADAVAPIAGGSMDLSFSVRAAGAADLFTSPAVQVYDGAGLCGQAQSNGSLVVHVTVPLTCAQPGDVLSFAAGGLPGGSAAVILPAPACAYEMLYDARRSASPAYLPVTAAAGDRFVPLMLSPLDSCPSPVQISPPAPSGVAQVGPTPLAGSAGQTGPTPQPGPVQQPTPLPQLAPTPQTAAAPRPAAPSQASPVTTLTLSVIDPSLPAAPLEQPAVTVFVAGVPCAHQESLDTQAVVLQLPRSCGQDGAALSFSYTARDPRFNGTSEVAACAVTPPPASGGGTAGSYRPALQHAVLQSSSAQSYGLSADPAMCNGPQSGAASPAAGLSAAASPAPAASSSATATAAPAARPNPTATPALAATPTPAPSPLPAPTPVFTAGPNIP